MGTYGNLTADFLAGFNSQDAEIDNPYLWSSDAWLAFNAGGVFARRGTATPIKARKSRGYSIKVWTADNVWLIRYDNYLRLAQVERLET